MLEETGIPYRIFPVNINQGDQFKSDFLKVSAGGFGSLIGQSLHFNRQKPIKNVYASERFNKTAVSFSAKYTYKPY